MRTIIRTSTSSNITCQSQGCRRVIGCDTREAAAARLRAFFAAGVMSVWKRSKRVVTWAAGELAHHLGPHAWPSRNRLGWKLYPALVYAG